MAINDRKIEKLKERSAQLEKRIKEDTAEKKRIDTQIKVLSYENLRVLPCQENGQVKVTVL